MVHGGVYKHSIRLTAQQLFNDIPHAYVDSRKTLPVEMLSRNDFNIFSVLKNCIGKELSKVTMPVIFNEPLSFLERMAEFMEYSKLLRVAANQDNSVDRLKYVSAFVISSLSSNWDRLGKPFNPLLGETYEIERDDFRMVAEQVKTFIQKYPAPAPRYFEFHLFLGQSPPTDFCIPSRLSGLYHARVAVSEAQVLGQEHRDSAKRKHDHRITENRRRIHLVRCQLRHSQRDCGQTLDGTLWPIGDCESQDGR